MKGGMIGMEGIVEMVTGGLGCDFDGCESSCEGQDCDSGCDCMCQQEG